ncbi:MAG: ribonuclease Z, partial [Candidatus Thorarchaeota archaeon]
MRLQNGEKVILEDGSEIHPEQVMGSKRKGRKFTFITDTSYFHEASNFAAGSDLLICEGMFEKALIEDA